ncbi:NUDIX domain-containing protein [Sphingomonas sp. RB56-2]|uniref:NUDIX domain-containing protein n=1 Tax=Sphingomonas brevis TaxID=2908206 RepID=A0ABT0S8V1_9SPHN|nr:NUDIX domain-containing protein [Sphingomonas brevis]MCL6740813.1 NUDIX domain-containing protein [Sphingomonas brevis]
MSDDAIPAATLVVWRDPVTSTGEKPQILVVERSARMAFAAGAVVFPGGRIDDVDRSLAAALGRPDEAAKVTAIRETIEETAVVPAMQQLVSPGIGLELQRALIEGEDFGRLLTDRELALDLDALTPFARWMPAFKHARKFDTLFYLARAPEGQWLPVPQPGECEAAEWASAEDLLERIERGESSAIFPTKRNLERLARLASLDAAIDDARSHSLDTIIPWIEEIGGETHVRIPEDRGYPVISEPLATAFRA